MNIPGTDHELNFWKDFVKTDRFLDGWVAPIQTPELRPEIADFIKESLPKGGKVLDAASGPVSILNGLVPKSRLTTVDLLGEQYEELFDFKAHKIKPPIATACEDLEYDGEFDIVNICNGLDHCQDVPKAYGNLLKAVAPGGYLIVAGFEKEGTFEKWQGLHQWDLNVDHSYPNDKEGDVLMMKNKAGSMCWDSGSYFAETLTLETGKKFFIWIVKKEG